MDASGSKYCSNCIETELKDILTLDSCTTLISELIKFILYRKQQLPYTFDRLKYVVAKKNANVKQETVLDNSTAFIERQFKVAEEGLLSLELIFNKTREELANSRKGSLIEVALLFGSTPMTPKQVYRIHLPEILLSHFSVNHPERKNLQHLLHSILHSYNLGNILKKPMNPTNMFVFIKKKIRPEENKSEWFIPKNRFEIPKIGEHFHIKFHNPDQCLTSCGCQNFKIFSDEEAFQQDDSETFKEDSDSCRTEDIWYQACTIFKGFTDVYINGVSVANLWLK